ncbi:cohesin domain-containing protein [Halostagnicola sp. A-GB9-2]|uniref:cohesin domain-containing protein n=1 Tax=Halostagnicola sp. A-GB9-2 TaxID=3048066 RepID=UPI0024C09F61|nr:cohesin domain-containing protein [Halostagnicola sp. A-GB9-2]MDJ1431885.1 cellulosome anchor protein [Halostagnicola sp. A-GB9-2]
MNGFGDGRVAGTWVLVAAVGTAMTLGIALGVGALAGTASAGDGPAVVTPEPETVEAEPGEEFDVTVNLESHGGYGLESQVESVRLLALAHPDYLEVTDIEAGTWLEEEETEVRTGTEIADDGSIAEAVQYRDPPAGGTTNDGEYATLTVRVAEDAPPSEATLEFDETGVMLTDSYPQAVTGTDLTVEIDGGGEHHVAYDHGDLEAFGHAETFAETGGGEEIPTELAPPESQSEDEDASDDGGSDGGDSVPGFTGVGVGLAALLGIIAVVVRSRL